DYEDESPIRVLHDLHCEIRTLKEDVSASLRKSCSEKQEIHDLMKASEILMQRNAADLGKIRELFKKYGYKPQVANSDSTVCAQNKSEEEKADASHLPTCTEKPPVPKDPLRDPRLSDFGLSQYAFSRTWSAVKGQRSTNAGQEISKNRTPLKTQSPRVLAKTPKCMLKMDDYECVTPKLEHFGISEHTMCMNEDYTMSLLHKTASTSRKQPCPFDSLACARQVLYPAEICLAAVHCVKLLLKFTSNFLKILSRPQLLCFSCFQLVKKNNHEVKVPEMTPREIMVTPGPKPKVIAEKADWMSSPMVLVFCTPDVKISSRTNSVVLSRSPETNELPLPSHAETPQCPDFQTRWLKPEAKVVTSNSHSIPLLQQTKQGEKTQSVTKNDATDKHYKEDRIPFAVTSDEYLKHFGDPSPPKLKPYDQLLSTPPPPEITRIPDDVLQLLSKYNHKVDPSKAKEMETKAGNSTRHESDFTDYCNKENR
ncbi:SKA3 protein, partial [Halcyon senegalensis]|nr:SKA3 protein [Halcyon senegalensis]